MCKIVTIFLFVLKHFTCTKIWILNTHSKSEYVFYYTMEANFVVPARFLLNFVNIIEASKSVSSCQLLYFHQDLNLEPHSKSEYVFYYTMEANFVVLARFLLNFVTLNEASKSVSKCQLLYFHQDLNLEPSL